MIRTASPPMQPIVASEIPVREHKYRVGETVYYTSPTFGRAAAEAFAAQLGKHAIRTKDRAGFVVNFLLVPYLMSAVRMLEDGFATREDVDEGMKRGCGHPMGPLTLCDLIGLDVLEAVCDSLYEEFKRPEYAPPALLRRMTAAGRLGRKSGRGFYDYERERAAVTAAIRP